MSFFFIHIQNPPPIPNGIHWQSSAGRALPLHSPAQNETKLHKTAFQLMKFFIIWNNLAMLPMVLDFRAAEFFSCTEMESKQKERDELQQTSSEPSCTSNPGDAEHFSGHCNLLYVRGIKSELKKKKNHTEDSHDLLLSS